jgi:general stress protein 26
MSDSKKHKKSDIYVFLKKSFFAVLSYLNDNTIKNELMIFNTTESGDFFLTIKRPVSWFSGIKENSDVNLLIYKEEENLKDIARVIVNGEAKLIEDMNGEEAINGFKIIGEKSPSIKHLIYEDEKNREEYSLIYVKAKQINYVSIRETIEGKEPTILERK